MGFSVRRGVNPPIVFIAQLGTGGDSWKPVVDRINSESTTLTYDRPGTGDAPGRPTPNPAIPHSVFARELRDLLDAEGITSPAVIVCHSFGGLIARAFAGQWPERVAGLVFVDPSIPQFQMVPTSEPKLDGDGPDATEIDVVRGQVEVLSYDIPYVPAVALTRTHGMWSGDAPPPHPAVEDLWLVNQRLLADQAAAPLIVANRCGHNLPRDAPALVAYAVTVVADAVSFGRPVEIDEGRLSKVGGHLDDGTPSTA